MTETTVHVAFTIKERDHDEFLKLLQHHTNDGRFGDTVLGFRADDYVQRRQALAKFVDQMEFKLRQNEHKKNWKEKPVEALFRLMVIELEEFKVAHEFFEVKESRPELVDIANFAMMLWDRLSAYDQNFNASVQDQYRKSNEQATISA